VSVVGECFFWYRLTRVVPDKFHRAVKRLCVCVCVRGLTVSDSVFMSVTISQETGRENVSKGTYFVFSGM